jgi:Spy/CpxP family protein refolding chaperone
MNRKHLMLTAGAVVLAGTVAACHHPRFSQEAAEDHAAWMTGRVARDLELNDAQKAKLDALKTVLLATGTEAMKQREADRREVTELLAQPTLDRARASALVTHHTRAIEAKAPEVIAAAGDFYDSLTPDQQAKLREEIADHMDHHPWH